jgi:hypothetical protein
MTTLDFLAPDGVLYSVAARERRRAGDSWDTWEAHIFAPHHAPLPNGLRSLLRPVRRDVEWTPDEALEAAALALTGATAPQGQSMQTVLTGSDPRLFKWATSIPVGADWRAAAEALFTRHERWLAEGTPYATEADKAADYHIINEQIRDEGRGYRWFTVQLSLDGQRPLSSHGSFSVVVHQPEAR